MSQTMFPPLPRMPRPHETIRINSDQMIHDIWIDMEATRIQPRPVVKEKSQLAKALKRAAKKRKSRKS